MKAVAAAALAALVSILAGCLMPRYLAQAAYGQLDLLARARSVDEVVADPEVDARTRILLSMIPDIKVFGARHGLDTRKNYKTFAQLDTDAAVWFVGAAPPLSFSPLKWCFPIVGCFAGLGWFDEQEALAQRRQLEQRGLDVIARPAAAYSTGGWFPDPILSTMLSTDDDAWAELANVVLHESTHASVLVPDEPYFNEGIAAYIGDAMADEWLIGIFGPDSKERAAYLKVEARREKRITRLFALYQALVEVYASKRSDAEKLAEKKRIIDEVVTKLRLHDRPNNASLVELRVYRASRAGFGEVHAACGDLTHMVAAAKKVRRQDFQKQLQDELGPVMERMKVLCREAGAVPRVIEVVGTGAKAGAGAASGTGTGTGTETETEPGTATDAAAGTAREPRAAPPDDKQTAPIPATVTPPAPSPPGPPPAPPPSPPVQKPQAGTP